MGWYKASEPLHMVTYFIYCDLQSLQERLFHDAMRNCSMSLLLNLLKLWIH